MAPASTSTDQDAEAQKVAEPQAEEILASELERLGRRRPPSFPSALNEIVFVFSICMSQVLTEYFVSGFTVLIPTLVDDLAIPLASRVWPASAFSLVIASTLLIFGRLGDIQASRRGNGSSVFLGGLAWLLLWSIIAGFSVNVLMLDLCRALQGLGAAAALPTGVMFMGSAYRPGPRKNLAFAIYGTGAVFGFFGGILVAGIVGQFLRWGWYFWIGGILTAVTLVTSLISIPPAGEKDKKQQGEKITMDYWGAATIVVGLTLTVFAITQSAHAPLGWRTPYIPVCFCLGILALLAAAYIEVRIATQPLLPASIFTTPSMTPLLFALFLLYGTWGIFSVYGTMYFENIMSATSLQIVAWYVPLGVSGLALCVVEGFILHLVPGRILFIISGFCAVGSQLLIALIPPPGHGGALYWAWIFPATILSTIGIDLSVIVMTVFTTTTLPLAQQGLAGGMVNSALQLGVAVVLGLSDIIQTATVAEAGLARSYKYTFWFGVGIAGVSLAMLSIWAKTPKASGDLTADEKAELARQAVMEDPYRG